MRPNPETPTIHPQELCELFACANLFVKDESAQPSGTWKDRRSKTIVFEALAHGVNTLALITSGNAGYSLAKHAKGTPLKLCFVVDKDLSKTIKTSLVSTGHRLVETDLSKRILTPEALIALARVHAAEVIWDVTNGFERSYGAIIDEIVSLKPDYLVCPIGSGEAYIGLYHAIKERMLPVKLIGVSPKECPSLADKLTAVWSPYTERITSLPSSEAQTVLVTEAEINSAFHTVKAHLFCEPSSAIAFAGLVSIPDIKTATVVVINTGRGAC